MFIFSTIAGLVVFFLAIAFLVSLFYACRSFETIFAILLILFCLDAIAVGLPILSVGKNIQIFDPIAVTLFLAAIIRFLFGAQKNIGAPQWALICMLILMSVPLVLGFKQYGMRAAPDFRWFFHFMAVALYASSFNFDQINFDRLAKYLLMGALTLILLTLFRWAAGAAGLGIADTWRLLGANKPFRVLNAGQAFFIAQVGLLFLIIRVLDRSANVTGRIIKSKSLAKETLPFLRQWSVVFSGITLAIAFMLMHRSVWVSMIAGMLLLVFLDQRHREGLVQILATFATMGCIVLIPLGLMGFLDSYFEALMSAFLETTEHHSSFADRYLGWEALLAEWWTSGNMLTYILGQPFGSGYYRKIAEFGASYSAEYTPHNFYVQTLLRAGVAGLILFISLIMTTGMGGYQTLSKLKKNRGPEFAIRLFLLVSVVMQVVFFLAYGARLEQGLLFGLAMAAATSKIHSNRGTFFSERLVSCRL